MKFIVIVLILVMHSFIAKAEVQTWNCNFQTRVDSQGEAKEKMNIVFKVDTIAQRAFMEGNIGISDIDIYIGDSAFSFTEKIASGAIQTTTITRNGDAVHSRNTIMLGEIIAAQHFGKCTFE